MVHSVVGVRVAFSTKRQVRLNEPRVVVMSVVSDVAAERWDGMEAECD